MLESIYIYNALCYFVTVCLSPRGPVFLTYTGGLHTFLHKWEGDSREDTHFTKGGGFSVGASCGYAYVVVSKDSKLFGGARILRDLLYKTFCE